MSNLEGYEYLRKGKQNKGEEKKSLKVCKNPGRESSGEENATWQAKGNAPYSGSTYQCTEYSMRSEGQMINYLTINLAN